MARHYTATMDAVSITIAKTLMAWAPVTDTVMILDKVTVTQQTQTSSEVLAIQVQRSTNAGTGSASTEEPGDPGHPAATVVVTEDHTVEPTAITVLHKEGWNVLAPFIWHPTPEERLVFPGTAFGGVKLTVAPGSAMVISCTIAWREIG